MLPALAGVGFVVLFVLNFVAVREIKALRAERDELANAIAGIDGRVEQLQELAAAKSAVAADGVSRGTNWVAVASGMEGALQARILELERRFEEAKHAGLGGAGLAPRDLVAEYNVSNPPTLPEEVSQPVKADPAKRGWGPEQVTGVPDTPRAGDFPTAWASREPDGGAEWLAVAFGREVDIAEVRIRESYNPGAITRVTGVVGGREITLWEGTPQRGPAPRDFVAPVQAHVQAGSIIVHLDTALVPGWNEIDAIELVGKDGSRQWAASANASSTFARASEMAQGPGE